MLYVNCRFRMTYRASKFFFGPRNILYCSVIYVRKNYHDGEEDADDCNTEYWGPVGETNDGFEGDTRGENCHTKVQQTAYYIREGRNASHQTGFEPQIQVLHI